MILNLVIAVILESYEDDMVLPTQTLNCLEEYPQTSMEPCMEPEFQPFFLYNQVGLGFHVVLCQGLRYR